MKIEVGMYVRFFNGDIGKIANYRYDEEFVNGHIIYLEKDNSTGLCCEAKDFKVSNNIIDLIEVGDYVNGRKVLSIHCDDGFDLYLVLDGGSSCDGMPLNQDIKSIVTKENFESISYKVGE